MTAVNAGEESAATNQLHVSYSVTSQWNDGFTGAISIQNTGLPAINSWTWPHGQKITQAWSAKRRLRSMSTERNANTYFTAIVTPDWLLSPPAKKYMGT